MGGPPNLTTILAVSTFDDWMAWRNSNKRSDKDPAHLLPNVTMVRKPLSNVYRFQRPVIDRTAGPGQVRRQSHRCTEDE